MNTESHVTTLLGRVSGGDQAAADELAKLIYADLHLLAERIFRREKPGHTLQPTVLVNDALLRLLGARDVTWRDRVHFYAFAARNMRQVLLDYARHKNAGIRRPTGERVCIDDVADLLGKRGQIDVEDFEASIAALEHLSELAQRQAAGVVLRVYAGLTDQEVAQVLGCSETTAKNDWRAARTWLRAQLAGTTQNT